MSYFCQSSKDGFHLVDECGIRAPGWKQARSKSLNFEKAPISYLISAGSGWSASMWHNSSTSSLSKTSSRWTKTSQLQSPTTMTSWTTNPQVGQNMTLWSREMPVLYHGHFAHFNLRKLGLTTSPIYINLIRWGALAKSVLLSIDLIDMDISQNFC